MLSETTAREQRGEEGGPPEEETDVTKVVAAECCPGSERQVRNVAESLSKDGRLSNEFVSWLKLSIQEMKICMKKELLMRRVVDGRDSALLQQYKELVAKALTMQQDVLMQMASYTEMQGRNKNSNNNSSDNNNRQSQPDTHLRDATLTTTSTRASASSSTTEAAGAESSVTHPRGCQDTEQTAEEAAAAPLSNVCAREANDGNMLCSSAQQVFSKRLQRERDCRQKSGTASQRSSIAPSLQDNMSVSPSSSLSYSDDNLSTGSPTTNSYDRRATPGSSLLSSSPNLYEDGSSSLLFQYPPF